MICTQCNRTVIGSERCPLCDAETVVAPTVAIPSQPKGFIARPGTALASLIPKWAVSFRGKCQCKSWEVKMNRWGPSGCELNRDQIVAHLLSQGHHLIPVFRVVPKSLRVAVANKMLTRAIEKSRQE